MLPAASKAGSLVIDSGQSFEGIDWSELLESVGWLGLDDGDIVSPDPLLFDWLYFDHFNGGIIIVTDNADSSTAHYYFLESDEGMELLYTFFS